MVPAPTSELAKAGDAPCEGRAIPSFSGASDRPKQFPILQVRTIDRDELKHALIAQRDAIFDLGHRVKCSLIGSLAILI